MISNCDTITEKVSKFIDYHFKSVLQGGKSDMKISGYFLEKIKPLGCIPDDAILVTTDVYLMMLYWLQQT